jgi:hypothetical protein
MCTVDILGAYPTYRAWPGAYPGHIFHMAPELMCAFTLCVATCCSSARTSADRNLAQELNCCCSVAGSPAGNPRRGLVSFRNISLRNIRHDQRALCASRDVKHHFPSPAARVHLHLGNVATEAIRSRQTRYQGTSGHTCLSSEAAAIGTLPVMITHEHTCTPRQKAPGSDGMEAGLHYPSGQMHSPAAKWPHLMPR